MWGHWITRPLTLRDIDNKGLWEVFCIPIINTSHTYSETGIVSLIRFFCLELTMKVTDQKRSRCPSFSIISGRESTWQNTVEGWDFKKLYFKII
jgi:hypothetical protein